MNWKVAKKKRKKKERKKPSSFNFQKKKRKKRSRKKERRRKENINYLSIQMIMDDYADDCDDVLSVAGLNLEYDQMFVRKEGGGKKRQRGSRKKGKQKVKNKNRQMMSFSEEGSRLFPEMD